MKKNVFSLLSVLLMLTLLTTPASAGGGIRLTNISFKLGSLIANGTLTGLGKTDVAVVLDASGIPLITCINQGENSVPGQSSPKVSASGNQFLDGNDPIRKNGKSAFDVETVDPETIPWDEADCPNANWTGRIDKILWTDATITVKDALENELLTREFTCNPALQTETSVSCEPK
jgi:hypothetical protein